MKERSMIIMSRLRSMIYLKQVFLKIFASFFSMQIFSFYFQVTKWKKVHIGVYVGKIFHESKRREKILNLVDEMELTGEILLDMKDTDFTEAGLAIGEAKLLIKRIGDDFKPKKKLGQHPFFTKKKK